MVARVETLAADTTDCMTLRTDTAAFLDVSRQLLDSGFCVRFRAHGDSMSPAVRDGDVLVVEPVGIGGLKRGDVVLYQHMNRPFAHRVVAIQRTATGSVAGLVLRGDAKLGCDAPVKPEQVLGRVVGPAIASTTLWRLGQTARRRAAGVARYLRRRMSRACSRSVEAHARERA